MTTRRVKYNVTYGIMSTPKEPSVSGEYSKTQARRVVTGLDAEGRSCIVSDGVTPDRLVTPGNTKCDLWRIATIPTSYQDGDGIDEVVTLPPPGGLVYRIASFPPDTDWDRSQGYGDSKGALAGSVPLSESGGIPGMHFTETVDIMTVLSGELWAITETGETLLRAGDTLVQRGTAHAWSNRTSEPATIVSVMIAAGP